MSLAALMSATNSTEKKRKREQDLGRLEFRRRKPTSGYAQNEIRQYGRLETRECI